MNHQSKLQKNKTQSTNTDTFHNKQRITVNIYSSPWTFSAL